jgi:hypothetical protein
MCFYRVGFGRVGPWSHSRRCIAPGYLDNRLAYAARLKVSPCQSARMRAGLR